MKITLTNPLMVNGKSRNELNLAFEKITTQDFLMASAEVQGALGRSESVSVLADLDAGMHLALAMRAAVRGDPEMDIEDVRRVSGRDVLSLSRAGRDFFLGQVSED